MCWYRLIFCFRCVLLHCADALCVSSCAAGVTGSSSCGSRRCESLWWLRKRAELAQGPPRSSRQPTVQVEVSKRTRHPHHTGGSGAGNRTRFQNSTNALHELQLTTHKRRATPSFRTNYPTSPAEERQNGRTRVLHKSSIHYNSRFHSTTCIKTTPTQKRRTEAKHAMTARSRNSTDDQLIPIDTQQRTTTTPTSHSLEERVSK